MVSTKAEARRIGAKWYFTGIPCKHGHVTRRYASGKCEGCRKMRQGSDRQRVRQAEWYERNGDMHRSNVSAYKKQNRAKVNEANSRYRANKFERTPAWAKYDYMYMWYERAAVLTKYAVWNYQVDHIVPMHGIDENGEPSVCGLNWEGNMQVLTDTANQKKSNRWTSDMGYDL